MAANFWSSNHRTALVTEDEFNTVPRTLLIKGIDCTDILQLKDFFCRRIFVMVHALKTARLRVATTACFYFHRFFLKYSMDQHDPRMIVPACIYLSVKVNEDNIQKAKTYTALALEHDASLLEMFTTKMLLDNEVLLLQALDCDLLVFSAHTDTVPLLDSMEHFEAMNKAVYEEHLGDDGKPVIGKIAWSAINEAYINCVEWLTAQQFDAQGMKRVLTHIAELEQRPQLSDEEVLHLLRRIVFATLCLMDEDGALISAARVHDATRSGCRGAWPTDLWCDVFFLGMMSSGHWATNGAAARRRGMTIPLPSTMRALEATPAGPVSSMRVVANRPVPHNHDMSSSREPAVLVKVEYAALNPIDWKMVEFDVFVTAWPHAFGCDMAGTVVAASEGVGFKEGDKVWAFALLGLPHSGTLAEYVRVPAAMVGRVPEGMAMDAAAAVGVYSLTAVFALYRTLQLPTTAPSEGFPVLVYGASSSVGVAALSLLQAAGYCAVAVASAQHHAWLNDTLGAAQTVDYREDGWEDAIAAAPENAGMKYALDAIGGPCPALCDAVLEKCGAAGAGKIATVDLMTSLEGKSELFKIGTPAVQTGELLQEAGKYRKICWVGWSQRASL